MLTKEDLENKNFLFYKVLDFYCASKKTSRARVTKESNLCYGSLNKSKTSKGRWVNLKTFFQICDNLEILPTEFIQKIYEFETNQKKGDK